MKTNPRCICNCHDSAWRTVCHPIEQEHDDCDDCYYALLSELHDLDEATPRELAKLDDIYLNASG